MLNCLIDRFRRRLRPRGWRDPLVDVLYAVTDPK